MIMNELEKYKITRIGVIDSGTDGAREYLRVEAVDHVLDLGAVQTEFDRAFQRDGSYPGGYYCPGVDVIPVPLMEGYQCLVVVIHRYDT